MNYTKNIGLILFDITASAGTERAIVNLSNLLTEFGHSNYRIFILSIKTKNGAPFPIFKDQSARQLPGFWCLTSVSSLR